MMALEKKSPCKVNLLLNILGRRPDGVHELETVFYPVHVFDLLSFEKASDQVQLSCNTPELPTDSQNLVFRAAQSFLTAAGVREGVRIHLEKRIPLAAGLGGGSGNAATTLLGMNELFGSPLDAGKLHSLAAGLGSDVAFFLQDQPALATGRGEQVRSLDRFPALDDTFILLIHPGFGISTPWAYQQLAYFPDALNGRPGRAQKLVSLLQTPDLAAAAGEFYNSLEAPALRKYPLLILFQEFLRTNGATVALMSGSGSTTFALVKGKAATEQVIERFKGHFGTSYWMTSVAA